MLNNIDNFMWPADFSCTIITDTTIFPNAYNINVGIEPLPDVDNGIAIGFKKLRFFVDNCLQNSVFIFKDNPILPAFDTIENNLVVFPTEPYDYFVGSVLLSKFVQITKKYFDITLITIDSAVGDRIQYCIGHPEECGLELAGDHWWNADSIYTGFGNNMSWDDLNINDFRKFEPKVVKGGLSEK